MDNQNPTAPLSTLEKVRYLMMNTGTKEAYQKLCVKRLAAFPEIASSYVALHEENKRLRENDRQQLKLIRILSDKCSSL